MSTSEQPRIVTKSVDSLPHAIHSAPSAQSALTHVPPGRGLDLPRARLQLGSCLGAFGVFVIWMALFATGILVDTEPYRTAISPTAVAKLKAAAAAAAGAQSDAAAAAVAAALPHPLMAWL